MDKLKDFARKLKELRRAQKNFFRLSRLGGVDRQKALDYSRELERELDREVEVILNDTGVEQRDLFR
jgi:hypothetical protein